MRVLAETDTYWSILTSPAHIMAELTIELATGLIGWLIGKRQWRKWLTKHDKEVHGH